MVAKVAASSIINFFTFLLLCYSRPNTLGSASDATLHIIAEDHLSPFFFNSKKTRCMPVPQAAVVLNSG